MALRFICIELRENLRCANVFLQFDQNLTETEFLKINVNNGELQIAELSHCISFRLSEFFSLEARTLTNLTVDENNASFRLSIEDVFENEKNVPNGKISIDLKPIFEIGQQTFIHCSNCKFKFFELTNAIRMCEFPSGAIDTSEFFCHAAADLKNLLLPRMVDLYYGFQFIVINSEHLENTTKQKSGHYYCRRCLQYLGETLFNDKAAKLWSDSLQLRHEEETSAGEIFEDIAPKVTTSILMQKIVNDCCDAADPLHSMNFAKVILEATFPNRKRKYLMIQILEKQLKVIRNKTPFLHNSCHNNNVLNENLIRNKSFKLLYRFVEESEFEEPTLRNLPVLLQYWQQDISIQTLKISYSLFGILLEELVENSLLIPEFYRYSKDDFKLSYVFY